MSCEPTDNRSAPGAGITSTVETALASFVADGQTCITIGDQNLVFNWLLEGSEGKWLLEGATG
jgi:hypothetical protein